METRISVLEEKCKNLENSLDKHFQLIIKLLNVQLNINTQTHDNNNITNEYFKITNDINDYKNINDTKDTNIIDVNIDVDDTKTTTKQINFVDHSKNWKERLSNDPLYQKICGQIDKSSHGKSLYNFDELNSRYSNATSSAIESLKERTTNSNIDYNEILKKMYEQDSEEPDEAVQFLLKNNVPSVLKKS